ncbi:hypothetical protein [Alicyclobacillus dauci]|uniref:Uncharacterized protein n=1 Tax=Alicyclobacillus dauci TaxID=1475485 RepID=A0ABY6Z3Q6_9BACL|nr:hypothetical protein [Alicyclobacillus dauci]WAH37512.1 hypothetical protein NZD86_02955 [Alicyclobacillus dauci]
MNICNVVRETMAQYELANEALLDVWDELDWYEINLILEKQQSRIEQLVHRQRMYHNDEHKKPSEILAHTLQHYERANRHLHEHWDEIPPGERFYLLNKQRDRLQDLRTLINMLRINW